MADIYSCIVCGWSGRGAEESRVTDNMICPKCGCKVEIE